VSDAYSAHLVNTPGQHCISNNTATVERPNIVH